MTAVDRGVTVQAGERRNSTVQQLILKPQQPQARVERRMSVDRRGDQPIDRRGDQPVDRRGDQPMDRRSDQPMVRRGDQPMDRKDDQLIDKIETYSLRREKEDRKKPRVSKVNFQIIFLYQIWCSIKQKKHVKFRNLCFGGVITKLWYLITV